MSKAWPKVRFGDFLKPNLRPYMLGPEEDANLVGMRLYGAGPFHRELKPAMQIAKKSHFMIRAGDVIYNKLFAWKGTFGVISRDLDGMFVSDKFPTYELDRRKIEEGYLRWFFRCPPLWDQAREMSTGSAALSKLTLNPPKFLLLEIPLPPLAEQRQIVARIEELAAHIHEACALRQQAAEEAERFVLSALLHLDQGPKWERKRISDSSEMSTGTTPPSERNDYYGGPLQWYTPGDLNNQRQLRRSSRTLSEAAVREGKARLFSPGTVLLVAIGGSLGKVGLSHERCSANQQITGIKFNATILPEFGFLWMQRLSKDLMNAAPHATLPIINQARIGQFEIVVPPLTEQRRIVVYLDGLQAKVDALKKLQSETAAELDALLPSILDRAFNGQL